MEQKKKKKVSMMMALLMISIIPTLLAAVGIAACGCFKLSGALEDAVYKELDSAATGLKMYSERDIRTNGIMGGNADLRA